MADLTSFAEFQFKRGERELARCRAAARSGSGFRPQLDHYAAKGINAARIAEKMLRSGFRIVPNPATGGPDNDAA